MTIGDVVRVAAVAAAGGLVVAGIHGYMNAQKKREEIAAAQENFSAQIKVNQQQQTKRVQSAVATRKNFEHQINAARKANGLPPLDLAKVQKFCTTGKL